MMRCFSFVDSGSDERKEIMQRVTNDFNQLQFKWFIRLVLKGVCCTTNEASTHQTLRRVLADLKLHLERQIMAHYHKDCYKLLSVCADLREVAEKLWNPDIKIEELVRAQFRRRMRLGLTLLEL